MSKNGTELQAASAALLRAAATGEALDVEDWRRWRRIAGPAGPWDDVLEHRRVLDEAAVDAWRERLATLEPDVVARHASNALRRAEIRRWLRGQPELRVVSVARRALPRVAGLDVVLWPEVTVRWGCDATATAWEQRVFPVSAGGVLLPSDAVPQSSGVPYSTYGYLHRSGAKGWGGFDAEHSHIAAEAAAPSVVLVGTVRTDVHATAGEYLVRATSLVEPLGGLFFFSQGVRRGRFVVQAHLRVEGSAVDPSEAGHTQSQELLSFPFGTDLGRPYGAHSTPGYVPAVPLTVDASVLGPGTVELKEVINYYVILEDYDDSAFARFSYFAGRFGTLCWELVRPSVLDQVVGTAVV